MSSIPATHGQPLPSSVSWSRRRHLYWIGPGRIDVAFLGAAQVDRYAILNSTVIGDYDHPKTRLPGAAEPDRTEVPDADELEALRELLSR